MKTKAITLVLLAFIGLSNLQAQVGVGTTEPDASAALDVKSTTQGFLPPRMTTTERNEINGGAPAVGLVIYNTTVHCLQWYNGSFWFDRCSGTLSPGGDPSSGGTAEVAAWTSAIGCAIGATNVNNNPSTSIRQAGVNETMVQGIAAPAGATITLLANVTAAGTYNLITDAINGVYYTASGEFTSTGPGQTVTLHPSGTPVSAGNYKWTIQATPSIDVYGSVITAQAPLGSSFISHYNGITAEVSEDNSLSTYTSGETFDQNATCQNKPISAYTAGCDGVSSVTVGANTYNTVEINGQCWLVTNLKEAPSQVQYAAYLPSDWTAASPGDQGYWGYYNTTDATGASGWQATEPTNPVTSGAGEGLLYQWCGAMEATISERSRGVCPEGFHIPSDCEWMYLEHGQGMSIAQQNGSGSNGWRAEGGNQGLPGDKLRLQGGNNANNNSGFSGLLAGWRLSDGRFQSRTAFGHFWSSNLTGFNTAYERSLGTDPTFYNGVRRRSGNSRGAGFSVRCLKD